VGAAHFTQSSENNLAQTRAPRNNAMFRIGALVFLFASRVLFSLGIRVGAGCTVLRASDLRPEKPAAGRCDKGKLGHRKT
jgi:hypothetical protein